MPTQLVDEQRRQLGLRLRELRRLKELTVRELAQRGGVSPSLVNQIETAKTSASIVSLTRIASGLEVPLAELFVGNNDRVPSHGRRLATVVKGDQRKRLQFPKSHVVYELLTPDLRWPFEFLCVQLEPDHAPLERRSHAGQECAVVIAGEMHVEIGNEEYELETGDSISFDSGTPHRIQNRGRETLVQLSVISPSSF